MTEANKNELQDVLSKTRYALVPIPTESLKEYFVNKEIIFMVDYAASRFKGMTFLTYLSNLGVPTDVIFTKDFDKAMYFELMQAYMSQRMTTYSENLCTHLAQLLLLAKGVPYEKIPYKTEIDAETIYEFLVENQELVIRWLHFLDSTLVLFTSSIPKLKQEFLPENLPVIEDKEFVGHNVVWLYNLPAFMSTYFGIPEAPIHLSYFKHQFEDYMFANRRLIEYAHGKNNVIGLTFEAMATGEIDAANPQQFIDKIKAIESEKNASPATPEN